MALILADRVRETTTTTGTGSVTLAGALIGFQTFSAAVGDGNTMYYVIAGQGTSEWEVGLGTYASAGSTLARTTVLSSSNGGSLVNFSAGTKDVWVDYAAGKAVTTDTLAYPPAIGGTTPAAGTFTTLTAQTEVLKGTGTNLFLQSSSLTTTWVPGDVTVTGSQTDPFGGTTAALLNDGTANSPHFLSQNVNLSAQRYTYSLYAKAGTANFIGIYQGSSTPQGAFFNLTTGAFTANIIGAPISYASTNVGNGWWRVSIVILPTAGAVQMLINMSEDGVNYLFTGTSKTVLVAAPQLEVGSTLNTYIPTTTTAVYGTPALSFSGVAGLGLQVDGSLYASSAGTGNVRLYTNNVTQEQLRVAHTASAVNYVQVTGAATGSSPAISAQGSDANIGLEVQSKGSGNLLFRVAGALRQRINGADGTVDSAISASGGIALKAIPVTSQVNYLQAAGNATGLGVQFSAQGSDTNISQVFQSKGTGAVDLAAGSSGVNISNGGTVTALTRTVSAFNYTSQPSVAISAPTTAGGVQATGVQNMYINTATVTAGGTGYTVGDVLTVVGGTPITTAATLTVSAVSAGVITAVTSTNFNQYSVLPSSPISVTGGSGSGATFTPLWGNGALTITNAGSGYVEQPTVTVSGGGGSGAAAYATVGSATKITSLAGSSEIWTSSGRQIVFGQAAATTPSTTWTLYNDSFGRSLLQGSSTAGISSGAAANLQFFTNSTAQEQLRVSHTASAVNYVQVTGAATGAKTSITSTGSDSSVGMLFNTKGSAYFEFQVASRRTFQVGYTTGTDANYLQANANAAGSAPILSSQGSDTNIDLTLTPKGTGGVTQIVNGGSLTITRNSAINMMKVTAANVQNLALQSTGGGSVYLKTGDDTSTQFVAAFTASAVNFLQAAGSVTGSGVTLSAQGSDTNIDLTLTPKGTGNVVVSTGQIYQNNLSMLGMALIMA